MLRCLLTRMDVQRQSIPPFPLLTYRHVKNLFTHLLDRGQLTSYLKRIFFNIYEPEISIYDVYTSQ